MRLIKCFSTLLFSITLFCSGVHAAPGTQTFTVNFIDSDIREVIDFIHSVTGHTYVVHPEVRGRVYLKNSSAHDAKQLEALFMVILKTHGFELVKQGEFYSIMPAKKESC